MGILLYLIAKFVQWLLTPLFMIYSVFRLHNFNKIERYFGDIALSLDQLGNVMGASIMNDFLLKKNPIKLYGNPDETISHVTSVNYFSNKLTVCGVLLVKTLNSIDKGHIDRALTNEQ